MDFKTPYGGVLSTECTRYFRHSPSSNQFPMSRMNQSNQFIKKYFSEDTRPTLSSAGCKLMIQEMGGEVGFNLEVTH